jgi:hypothetical protein
MKIADGVEMLELEMNMMGRQSTIHPTLLYNSDHAVMVDVGMPGQKVNEQFRKLNNG